MFRFVRRAALLLGFLIGLPLVAFAEAPPPAAPLNKISWKATMKRMPSTGLQMGALSVTFENTRLDDVRRVAPAGKIAHRGEAGESIYWLCYTSLDLRQIQRIWIIADGEMGGPEHYVTGISAQLLADVSATVDCPALPDGLKPLSLDKQLWLGASRDTVTAKLGPPSYRKDGWRSYDFQGKVPGNCKGGGFDRVGWLRLHFQNGRANSLDVGEVTSC